MTSGIGLTPLQKEIIESLVAGFGLQQTADANDMSMAQLKIQLSSIWVKTGTRSQAELLKWYHSR